MKYYTLELIKDRIDTLIQQTSKESEYSEKLFP